MSKNKSLAFSEEKEEDNWKGILDEFSELLRKEEEGGVLVYCATLDS